jgi:integrase
MSTNLNPDYKPRLYHGGWDVSVRWYIDFRIWDTDKKKFVRRQYTGMNKHKTLVKRKEAALAALDEIEELLKEGVAIGTPSDTPQNRFDLERFTMREAITYYLNYKNDTLAGNEEKTLVIQYNQGRAMVSKNTFKTNRILFKLLTDYLAKNKQQNILLKNFSDDVCHRFFQYCRTELNHSAKTQNNYRRDLSALFNFYKKTYDLPIKNPTLKLRRVTEEHSVKHPAYTAEQITRIVNKIREDGNDQLLLFIECIYYLFLRPREELRLLKVKDIGERTVFVRAENAKTSRGEHVTIPLELQKRFEEKKIRTYPGDYYVFSLSGEPGTKPVGVDYFYTHHRKILQSLGLEGYSMYGYKHTGAIALYEQTKDIVTVKNHCRHTSTQQTETYLRAYGVMVASEVLNMRKFG